MLVDKKGNDLESKKKVKRKGKKLKKLKNDKVDDSETTTPPNKRKSRLLG